MGSAWPPLFQELGKTLGISDNKISFCSPSVQGDIWLKPSQNRKLTVSGCAATASGLASYLCSKAL
jgi:hypothetical protein